VEIGNYNCVPVLRREFNRGRVSSITRHYYEIQTRGSSQTYRLCIPELSITCVGMGKEGD